MPADGSTFGSEQFGPVLREVAQHSPKPFVASFLSAEGVPADLAVVDEQGALARGSVPSYSTPERAVIALAKAAQYARWRRRPVGGGVGGHRAAGQRAVPVDDGEVGRHALRGQERGHERLGLSRIHI